MHLILDRCAAASWETIVIREKIFRKFIFDTKKKKKSFFEYCTVQQIEVWRLFHRYYRAKENMRREALSWSFHQAILEAICESSNETNKEKKIAELNTQIPNPKSQIPNPHKIKFYLVSFEVRYGTCCTFSWVSA
jgi:hypothetical protein